MFPQRKCSKCKSPLFLNRNTHRHNIRCIQIRWWIPYRKFYYDIIIVLFTWSCSKIFYVFSVLYVLNQNTNSQSPKSKLANLCMWCKTHNRTHVWYLTVVPYIDSVLREYLIQQKVWNIKKLRFHHKYAKSMRFDILVSLNNILIYFPYLTLLIY